MRRWNATLGEWEDEPKVQPVERVERWVLSADLGKVADPTAVTVMQTIIEGTGEWTIDANKIRREQSRTRHLVRHCERLPLQTSYVDQIAYFASLLSRPPLTPRTPFVMDGTGCGLPVVDMARKAGLWPEPVIITGGAGEARKSEGGLSTWHVGKALLVTKTAALLDAGALQISPHLKEAAILKKELSTFDVGFTGIGNMMFSARSGAHDDMVLSLALAAWWASRRPSVAGMVKLLGAA